MADPQPAFGRFIGLPGVEPQPRDGYEWLGEADELLSDARHEALSQAKKVAHG